MISLYIGNVEAIAKDRDFSRCLARVDETRREKVMKHARQADRCRSLLAGELLQLAVKTELGLPKDSPPLPLAYSYGAWGKPYLSEYEQLHFNLSHSGNYVICAMAGHPVGVDIQEQKESKQAVAKRFFSSQDAALLQGLSKEEQDRLFCRLWATKEACVKLTGEGMAKGLDRLITCFEKKEIVIASREKEPEQLVYFALYEELPGYVAAVCSEAQIALQIHRWEEG